MSIESLKNRILTIKKSLPPDVLLVAAAKTRTVEEVKTAIISGIKFIGYNYIQEAEQIRQLLNEWESQNTTDPVRWHLIGHLQRNKAKKAVNLFDMIETVDSLRIAEAINRHSLNAGKIMPILIEINSGRESNKTGVHPDEVISLVKEVAKLPNIKIQGLMTMGPRFGNPEDARPYFQLTRKIRDQLIQEKIEGTEIKYLSMGMSNSYRQAIEEGANIVRIGTRLFGERK
ncbi:YggS family pyridoxal phosphate-dependent enzyme [bacterium]|nr:YggS family pyridoxal phosphate-dependent enzyme [candidate division CSSED10-310 bacterium]